MNIRYRYSYSTVFRYYPPVERHSFRLRYLPMACSWQRPDSVCLELSPVVNIHMSTDSQGNGLQWGEIIEPHDSFTIKSSGIVTQTASYREFGTPAPIYTIATALTGSCEEMMKFYGNPVAGRGVFDTASHIMSRTHELIEYVPGATDWRDSALTSWKKRKGVCQDMAHIMIAVCRKLGIASRYVAGLIEGEGQTHAWVEVSDGCLWLPFDPTHDRRPEQGYMKISHGRDASDCATVRGHFFSLTTESMDVECKLEKI